MGLRFKGQEYGECFFVTTSFLDHKPLSRLPEIYKILANALNYQIEETDAKLVAYVLMPTHIHLLLITDGSMLASLMRDFKKYTAQQTLPPISGSKHVWQSRYDRQVIWSEKVFLQKIQYIHNNPVKAGLVGSAEHWYWSSAADYCGRRNGPVQVWLAWHF